MHKKPDLGCRLADDHCLQTLYPPGTCGTYCNQHTYDCYRSEITGACCSEAGHNCEEGHDVPNTCPVGCAASCSMSGRSHDGHVRTRAERGDGHVQTRKANERVSFEFSCGEREKRNP